MSSFPDWLEPLVRLEDFNGDVEAYIARLFELFEKDFIKTSPTFRGKKVLYDKKDDSGKPQAFTHITTEQNHQTKQRELCLRRCERITWIKAVIENADDEKVLVWEKEQKTSKRRDIRTFLFLADEDFLVILQEIKWGHYLITAIYVDNPNQKRKHLRAYAAYEKSRSLFNKKQESPSRAIQELLLH